MVPAIEQLLAVGYPVKKIDIDKQPELAKRYKVDVVPMFIVVDASGRELARVEGPRPAKELARVYRQARTKLLSGAQDNAEDEADTAVEPDPAVDRVAEEDEREAEAAPSDEARPVAANPDPWKTVVRIKVHGNGTIGFGSGTIIYSSAEESIILTCAHIFKMDAGPQKPPAQFPLPISIDLFDGTLHANARSKETPQVHYDGESFKGQAIDYDFNRDVGLIRIRPGRKLAASRVVPPNWAPTPGMKMTAVGCSEGNDATAWSTRIIKPGVQLFRNSAYEATECEWAPKQGRSGGRPLRCQGLPRRRLRLCRATGKPRLLCVAALDLPHPRPEQPHGALQPDQPHEERSAPGIGSGSGRAEAVAGRRRLRGHSRPTGTSRTRSPCHPLTDSEYPRPTSPRVRRVARPRAGARGRPFPGR